MWVFLNEEHLPQRGLECSVRCLQSFGVVQERTGLFCAWTGDPTSVNFCRTCLGKGLPLFTVWLAFIPPLSMKDLASSGSAGLLVEMAESLFLFLATLWLPGMRVTKEEGVVPEEQARVLELEALASNPTPLSPFCDLRQMTQFERHHFLTHSPTRGAVASRFYTLGIVSEEFPI